MTKKAVKFNINGTVQGVFFRQFCKDKADELGLKGYVRNLETSNVEVLVEGEKDKIEEMYTILKKGPPHAQIRDIKPEEKKWSGEFKDFSIMRF
jgi:acylphosphatase